MRILLKTQEGVSERDEPKLKELESLHNKPKRLFNAIGNIVFETAKFCVKKLKCEIQSI